MQRYVSQGLDLDTEICLVSSAGLLGAGLLALSLGFMTCAGLCVLSGIVVGMTTTLARTFLRHPAHRRHRR